MSDTVTAALRLVSRLQAELVRVTERARLAAQVAADAETHCHKLVEELVTERDNLLERLEHGKP